MPVYNKRGILLLPKVIVLNPKDGDVLSKSFLHLLLRPVFCRVQLTKKSSRKTGQKKIP